MSTTDVNLIGIFLSGCFQPSLRDLAVQSGTGEDARADIGYGVICG